MIDASSSLCTVGVFQDLAWAEKGIAALQAQGFAAEIMSFMAKESPETAGLVERFGGGGTTIEIKGLGTVRARGPIIDVLQGADEGLTRTGLAATARRLGFQSHDGRIFETLVGRGGILVAVSSDARAADALALMHSYGGGNAAIGAWGGRV